MQCPACHLAFQITSAPNEVDSRSPFDFSDIRAKPKSPAEIAAEAERCRVRPQVLPAVGALKVAGTFCGFLLLPGLFALWGRDLRKEEFFAVACRSVYLRRH